MELVKENKVLEFVSDFEKPEGTSEIRQQAFDALNGMDFPTTRVEEWKYTRVAKYTKKKYKQVQTTTSIDYYVIEGLNAHQLVFVNGFFDEKASVILDDDAVVIKRIEELDNAYYTDLLDGTEENVFSLINKAYETGGAYVRFVKETQAKHPVHLIHVIEGEEVIAMPRHFIHAEAGAKAEVVVSFHSKNSEDSFTNVVMEGHVEENANLTVQKLQTEDENVLHIARELFVQDKSSAFMINTITTGGLLTRNQLDVLVEGENCTTDMNGAYLGTGNQHIDNHTYIEQMYSHCLTNELYKGVMNDQSTGVFNGMILVRPDAQKIEAYQSNSNILLSEKSNVFSKPELEIYADDVRCSHGSTIGALDEEAVFYLQARGLSKESAEQLLISAFIGDVLDKVENEAVRNRVNELFLQNFGWRF